MESKENNYKLEWLGYNSNPNHNRIWGYLVMNDSRIYVFWGIKDKNLCFKLHKGGGHYNHFIDHIITEKERSGYKKITINEYENLCPGFEEKLTLSLMTTILSN